MNHSNQVTKQPVTENIDNQNKETKGIAAKKEVVIDIIESSMQEIYYPGVGDSCMAYRC